jgi:hypothetical protein
MDDKTKVTAAVSAVLHYIRSEEQTIAMQASQPMVKQMTAAAGLGNLMQMRAFKKVR